MINMVETVIIVAGGRGERMQIVIPKQFIEINSKPILMHTIETFWHYNANIRIILVLPDNQIEIWNNLCKKHNFTISHTQVKGGLTRFESVKNGLQHAGNKGVIGVHDGVRPLVNIHTITGCFNEAKQEGSAIPVIEVVDSLRQVTVNGSNSVDRSKFRIVQTPQVFSAEIIHNAYLQPYSPLFTDDASVVEASGVDLKLVQGNIENIKITTPFDLRIAELLLKP